VGIAPLRLLAAQVICLLGQPSTPGAFSRGRRTMAFVNYHPNGATHYRLNGAT
jgi:hypothetical protein